MNVAAKSEASLSKMMSKPEITKKTKIAVLYGGLSAEREVSLRSGNNCFAALQRLGYEKAELVDVDTDLAQVIKSRQAEVAFLCLHGKYGEDGTVQGLLELLRIPYTGSGVLASAIAMSKPLTKQVLKASALPYPPTYILDAGDDIDEFLKSIPNPPIMVKPINEGSSVGVVKIEDAALVRKAIADTRAEYGGAIVETYIKGKEITVGVLEDVSVLPDGRRVSQFQDLPILELRPKSKAGFYDYEAKYTKGMTEFVLPAELSAATTKKAQEIAVKTFKALHCSGYARVDMMVDSKDNPLVLEVNSLPGMTDTSDLPAMAEVAGIPYDALVERILFSAGLDK